LPSWAAFMSFKFEFHLAWPIQQEVLIIFAINKRHHKTHGAVSFLTSINKPSYPQVLKTFARHTKALKLTKSHKPSTSGLKNDLPSNPKQPFQSVPNGVTIQQLAVYCEGVRNRFKCIYTLDTPIPQPMGLFPGSFASSI